MKYKKIISGAFMLLASVSCAFGQVTILSGSERATQYRFVEDIAAIVAPSLSFKIVNKATDGVSYNFDQLTDPKSPFKLALIQADFLYYMHTQDMRLNTNLTKNLTVVLPLGYQQIHLITKASKGYTSLKDLDKRTVAIGSADQGTYRTALLIKERSQVGYIAKNTHFDASFSELNLDKIDAFFMVSSAPIQKLDVNPQSMPDKLALIPLVDFNDWAKYYKPDTIYKADYKWLEQDVPTYSVPVVLVVNESKLTEAERAEVMALKAAIQSKLEELKAKGHPKWKQIDLESWNESDWAIFK